MRKYVASVVTGLALLAASGVPSAHAEVSFGITLGVPVFVPAPVYYAPRPVYYVPPAYYVPPRANYYYDRPWHGHYGHRHHGHGHYDHGHRHWR
jgi:hypothetical protein